VCGGRVLTLPLTTKEYMEVKMEDVVDSVIMKGAGNVLFGGGKMRGPNATAEFVYEVMINVALEMTDKLPLMFENERIHNEQLKSYFINDGNKGKYTNSFGWSKGGENKFSFSVSPTFFNYFQRIIAPYLGGEIKGFGDENSKIWKHIKKLIMSGDKDKIRKLQDGIRKNIIKESKKSVKVAMSTERTNDGADNSKVIIETA